MLLFELGDLHEHIVPLLGAEIAERCLLLQQRQFGVVLLLRCRFQHRVFLILRYLVLVCLRVEHGFLRCEPLPEKLDVDADVLHLKRSARGLIAEIAKGGDRLGQHVRRQRGPERGVQSAQHALQTADRRCQPGQRIADLRDSIERVVGRGAELDFNPIVVCHGLYLRALIDQSVRKHRQQLVIVLRRSRPRFVAERGGEQPAQRRTFRPRPAQFIKKRNIDLVENLLASPVQFDHKLGDERAPLERFEALAACYSPAPVSTFLPPACSITTGSAATSSPSGIGRSKNSSRVRLG